VYGLWRVGPAKAKKILDNNPQETWDDVIMDLYINEDWGKVPAEKRPITCKREYAISQARCVRILQTGEYDPANGNITYWSPNNQVYRQTNGGL
jgi:hypothetical protein